MTEVDPAFSGPAFSASITSRLPAAATASSHPPDMTTCTTESHIGPQLYRLPCPYYQPSLTLIHRHRGC